MLSSQAFDLGVGESFGFLEMKLIIRTRRDQDPFSDLVCDCKIQNDDFKIEIRISQSNATLEFVPEEARLLIADEDDQFFFRSDGSCTYVNTSKPRILGLLSLAM